MENTIRISGQNYILEANGRLWNLLSEASAETESETAETESEHPAQIKN